LAHCHISQKANVVRKGIARQSTTGYSPDDHEKTAPDHPAVRSINSRAWIIGFGLLESSKNPAGCRDYVQKTEENAENILLMSIDRSDQTQKRAKKFSNGARRAEMQMQQMD
jgi:hypothetical protein